MLINVLKWLYFCNALLIMSMIIYGKIFVFRKKEAQFVSDYCATIAGLVGSYALLSIVFAWIMPETFNKMVMVFFAISPFVLGVITNYYTEKFFSVLQVLLLLISALFVIL